MPRIAYVNGAFVPLEEAKISVLDRGFLFADGIYEVTAVLEGKPVDFGAHVARLKRSLEAIALACPVPDADLLPLHKELIRRNELHEGLVYLEITRGPADRDFLFPANTPPTLVMFTQAKNIVDAPVAKSGIAVKSVRDIRWARRDIKSVGLLAQVLAKQAAADEGCQEAWLLAPDGSVNEGGSSSAFIITRAGALVTRPTSEDILPGCTRLAVLKLAQDHQLRVEERTFTLDEAFDAAEAFVTSASSFVMPVVKVDGRTIGAGVPGPLTARLRDIYIDHCRRTAE